MTARDRRSVPCDDRPCSIAMIVPVLDESQRIVAALERLRRDFPGCELVVVDGGSADDTAALASPYARVLQSAPGRARQMNAGAQATSSEVLWFVHADTEIDPDALDQIRAALADERTVGGGLSLRFDRRSVGLDYLAWSSNQRARYLHWIFGDQAMFVRRRAFDALGGFPELPILEDLELSRRLRGLGHLTVIEATSTASARRFVEHGTWPMIAFMQYLKALYFLGVDPEVVRRRYVAGPPSLARRRGRSAQVGSAPASRVAGRAAGARPGLAHAPRDSTRRRRRSSWQDT